MDSGCGGTRKGRREETWVEERYGLAYNRTVALVGERKLAGSVWIGLICMERSLACR